MPAHPSLTAKTDFRFDFAHLRSLKAFKDFEPQGEQTLEWLIECHFHYELEDLRVDADVVIDGQVLVITVPTDQVPRALCVFREAKIWH